MHVFHVIRDKHIVLTSIYRYVIFFMSTAILIPTLIIFFCYIKILLHVKAVRNAIKSSGNGNLSFVCQQSNGRKRELALAKTLFVVFVSFVACWLPYAGNVLSDPRNERAAETYVICAQLAHLSSSINWILYGITNRRFRLGYKQIVLCYKRNSIQVTPVIDMAPKHVLDNDDNKDHAQTKIKGKNVEKFEKFENVEKADTSGAKSEKY